MNTIQLKTHQLEGVDVMLMKGRVIVADVAGLGKTYQAIAAAFAFPTPRLFVVPSYLQHNWYLAITNLFPGAVVVSTQGNNIDRNYQIYDGIHSADCIVTTYEHLRIHSQHFQRYRLGVAVFDEAQKLRGRGYIEKQVDIETGEIRSITHERSLQAKAAYDLNYLGLFLLTGTPQVRDCGDWFALLSMINRKRFSSYWSFVKDYAHIQHTPYGDKIGRVKDKRVFRSLIKPYILRRTYKDAGIEMPEAIVEEIYIKPAENFLAKYRRIRNTYRVEDSNTGNVKYLLSAGAIQSELYKLVSSLPQKLEAISSFCRDNFLEQIVIWVWRRDTANLVEEAVAGAKRPIYKITGNIPPRDRTHIIAEFKKSTNGILIATIASLGLGENLQTAHITVFYEESYLPTDNEQAIARLRRLGQTRPVTVKHLLVENTVDIATHETQKKRGEEADSLFVQHLFSQ